MDHLNIFLDPKGIYVTSKPEKKLIKLYGLTKGHMDGWCVKLYFLSRLT